MSSNQLHVPLRTTERAPLIAGLSHLIEDVYEQHPDRFRTDIEELDSLRQNAASISLDSSGIETLTSYFTALSAVTPKFPYDTGIEFVWYNTLGYATRAAVSNCSFQFDRINVLYNIGALHSYLPLRVSRTSSGGLKEIFRHHQLSAGSFRFLIDHVLPEYREILPLGLEPDTLECLYWLSMAQAQESFWQKALLDGVKNGLAGKLSFQVSSCYSKALAYANKSPSIRSEWVHHFVCKKFHFEGAGQYRLALDCLDKGKYGEEVARLRDCIKACEEGLSSGKYVVAPVLDDLRGLYTKAREDYKQAQKDNDLIYLQIVPTTLPAYNIGDLIAKPISPPGVDLRSSSVPDLFKDLLPHALYQASKAYFQKLQDFLRKNIITDIENLTQALHDDLIRKNLPGCLSAIEEPQGIPHDLFVKSDDIKTHGGSARLQSGIDDMVIFSHRSKALLEEGKELLDKEAAEDKYMRTKFGTDRWILRPSIEAGSHLHEKYNTLKSYLSTAESSDNLVREKFKQIEPQLSILEKGRREIEPYIPNSGVVNLSAPLKRSLRALRDKLGNIKSIEIEREHYVSSIKVMSMNIDMTEEFKRFYEDSLIQADPYATVDPSQFEPAYENIVSRFQKDLTWVQRQESQQTKVLSDLNKEMAAFMELSETESYVYQRQSAIQSLEIAYFKFLEIRGNLDEGSNFYNPFLGQLSAFVQACRSFVKERRLEAGNLEKNLSSHSYSSPGGSAGLAAPVARHPGTWTHE